MSRVTQKIVQAMTRKDIEHHPYYSHIQTKTTQTLPFLRQALLDYQRQLDADSESKNSSQASDSFSEMIKSTKKSTKKTTKKTTKKSTSPKKTTKKSTSPKKTTKKTTKKTSKKTGKKKAETKEVTKENCMDKDITWKDIRNSEAYKSFKGRSQYKTKEEICKAVFGTKVSPKKKSPVKAKIVKEVVAFEDLTLEAAEKMTLQELKALPRFKNIKSKTNLKKKQDIIDAIFDNDVERHPEKPTSFSEFTAENCVTLSLKELRELPEFEHIKHKNLKTKALICEALLQLDVANLSPRKSRSKSPTRSSRSSSRSPTRASRSASRSPSPSSRSASKSPSPVRKSTVKKTTKKTTKKTKGGKKMEKLVKSPWTSRKTIGKKSEKLDDVSVGEFDSEGSNRSISKSEEFGSFEETKREPEVLSEQKDAEDLNEADKQILEKLVGDWQEAFQDEFELDDNIDLFLYDNQVGFLQSDGKFIGPFDEEPLTEREIEVLSKLDRLVSTDKLDAMGPIPR